MSPVDRPRLCYSPALSSLPCPVPLSYLFCRANEIGKIHCRVSGEAFRHSPIAYQAFALHCITLSLPPEGVDLNGFAGFCLPRIPKGDGLAERGSWV